MTPRLVALAATAAVLAGCGSTAAKTHDDAASAQWRQGLARWDSRMTRAIDELSVLFSEQTSMAGIQHGDAALVARVTASEATLLDCRKRVVGLGRAPGQFTRAHLDALLACRDLELGATLVRDGVRRLQMGLGAGALGQSSEPLGSGQDALQRVRLELKQAG